MVPPPITLPSCPGLETQHRPAQRRHPVLAQSASCWASDWWTDGLSEKEMWAREGRDWHRDRAGPWHPCGGRGTLLLAKIFPASGYDDHWSSQLGTPVTAPFTAPGALFAPQGQTRGRMATTGCNKPPLLLLEASFAVPAPVWPLSTPEFANASSSYTPHLKVSSWDLQGHVLEPHRHQCPPRVPMSLMQ